MTGTPSPPRFRVRRSDGSELLIPSVEALAREIAQGGVLPGMALFDAGTGRWSVAGEVPVVRFVVDELRQERPEGLAGWPTDVESSGAVGASAGSPPPTALPEPPRRTPTAPARVARRPNPLERAKGHLVPLLPFLGRRSIALVLVGAGSLAGLGVLLGDRWSAGEIEEPAFVSIAFDPTFSAAAFVDQPFPVATGFDAGLDRLRDPEPPAASGSGPEPMAGGAASAPPEMSVPLDIPVPPEIALPAGIEILPPSSEDPFASDDRAESLMVLPLPPPPSVEPEDPSARPVAIHHDVAPELRNAEQVRQALRVEYPPILQSAGIGGTVDMWFYVGEGGVVERFEVNRSSGYPQLDEAALRVAEVFEFTPALDGDRPVAVWILFQITFAGR